LSANRSPIPQIGGVAPYKFYGTDAVHLARAGMVGLVYGPGGKYNTMPDERVELRDLFNAARVYARVIVETCA
jgi:acetylornithine deacetylase